MKPLNLIFVTAGALAILYGLLILWSVASSQRDPKQSDWLHSEEITRSKFHNTEHLRHLLEPERKIISTGRSKSRGYAMVAIGIVLIVFGIT